MNVAILGAEPASQAVAQIIENGYNPWLKTKLAEPLNVAGYTVGGVLALLHSATRSFYISCSSPRSITKD